MSTFLSNLLAADFKGATGPVGATGSTGPFGASGINGATGLQGASGVAGINGATGPQGVQGVQGASGATGSIPAGTVTETGTQTLTNKSLDTVTLNNGYTEEVYAVVDAAGVALSPTNGSIQTWTLGASRTPTSGTWNAGQSMTLMIDDGSAFTVTWTTLNVIWETDNGSAPTLATTGFTVIVLWKVGTQIYGARVGNA